MKYSQIILILLASNTSIIVSEPLAIWIRDVNPWLFIFTEMALILGLFVNNTVRDLRKACELELGDLNLFVVGKPKR